MPDPLIYEVKNGDKGERLTLFFAAVKRWEQQYAPFAFQGVWHTRDWVAIVRESKQSAPEHWQTQGISYRYVGFGVPFGESRQTITCLDIAATCDEEVSRYDGVLSGPWAARCDHPELFAGLEPYSVEELLHFASLAFQQYDDLSYTFPAELFAGRPEIRWRIPQKRFLESGETPLQIATLNAVPATMERYDALCAYMRQLGPRSVLVDLREAPHTHRELQRRQHLKRNRFFWPQDRDAQWLHPIGLRQRFGMKYRQLSHIVSFARENGSSDADATPERRTKVWLHHPAVCAPLAELIMQRYPLLLVDEDEPGQTYATSRRRAIVLHLLSLFSAQLEPLPDVADLSLLTCREERFERRGPLVSPTEGHICAQCQAQ